ncbi:MAG: hypothetical protein PWR06_2849 [Thermoanaerobacteraceae bacterium]|nr:hypothetical protein [Thermoanaerobacteraceae bacterium]
MKRALAVIVALVLFLGAVPFSMASDATADPEKKFPELQMTEQQKSRMISLKTQMLDLKKEIIKQNVANGTLSSEQAKKMEERINARLEQLKAEKLEQDFHRHHSPKGKNLPKSQ